MQQSRREPVGTSASGLHGGHLHSPREKDVIVPTFNSVRSILQRQRSKNVPTLPTTRADIDITGKWANRVDGKRYLIPSDPNEMIIFSSDEDLCLLSEFKSFF